jgi:hypothetical protein
MALKITSVIFFLSSCIWQERNSSKTQRFSKSVAGNGEGNKVTKTTLQEAGIFIMLADSREIISQSPEPGSESGDELYTPQAVL